MHATASWWIGFNALFLLALFWDLAVCRYKKNAPFLSLSWIVLAVAFGLLLLYVQGADVGMQFFTAYLIEKSLSIDNLFVFSLIFSQAAVPESDQPRTLLWGTLGAIILRGGLIFSGIALIEHFQWLLYLFGAFLVITGAALYRKPAGSRFVVRHIPKRVAPSPLFVVFSIECADLIFALDSIPAIFAVTVDPFIVYTSNALALVGLRSLYGVLQPLLDRFQHLHYGVCLMLMFVGVKMLLHSVYAIPTSVSLLSIVLICTVPMLIPSLRKS